MDEIIEVILEQARQIGVKAGPEFSPALLVPEPRIRDFCLENKCGHYQDNYMCPPDVGTLDEMAVRLRKFQRSILLQYTKSLEVQKGNKEIRESKVNFHRMILQLEDLLKSKGLEPVWGMSGGSCGLCEICQAKVGEPCLYPEEARNSLEAAGIDVLALLDKLGLDNKFYPDKITWTGCILF